MTRKRNANNRRFSLAKKAYEYSYLHDSDVLLVVRSGGGEVYSFVSHPELFRDFLNTLDIPEVNEYKSSDFDTFFKMKKSTSCISLVSTDSTQSRCSSSSSESFPSSLSSESDESFQSTLPSLNEEPFPSSLSSESDESFQSTLPSLNEEPFPSTLLSSGNEPLSHLPSSGNEPNPLESCMDLDSYAGFLKSFVENDTSVSHEGPSTPELLTTRYDDSPTGNMVHFTPQLLTTRYDSPTGAMDHFTPELLTTHYDDSQGLEKQPTGMTAAPTPSMRTPPALKSRSPKIIRRRNTKAVEAEFRLRSFNYFK